MKLKSLLLAGALCLGGSAFLSARTRIFTIDKPTIVGNYNLPPGTYRMRVHGNTCEITDLNHFADKRPVSVTATRALGDERFHQTIVRAVNEGGVYRASEIDLSHSSTVVQFQ
ncbi:MAG TPA: hypothetical protein VKE70_35295 [Candidatus Solibacter sp.]|nr:hypothetical protein [Candidatus Solibacter sp.]